MRAGTRFPAGLVSAALVLAAGLFVPAAAQMRGAQAGGRSGWTPPFASAAPGMLSGIQGLLGTEAGMKLTSELPSFQAVLSFSPGSGSDLRAMGALAAHLPPDFEARLSAAVRRSNKDSDVLTELARTLGAAYQAAVPEAARAVESRAKQVALSVAYGGIDGRSLVIAADQLDRFGIYGPSVQEKAGIVRRMASQRIMEDAERIASNFLHRLRQSDEAPGEGRGTTYARSGRKEIPDAWKLRAYKNTEGARQRAERAPPGPKKADPMSKDLYARLGAAKGMGSAEIEAAYRRTAELYRPERYMDRDVRSIIAITMAFKRIEEAYAILGDPKKRAEYDRGGSSLEGPPAPNPLSDDYYERIGAAKDMPQAGIKAAYRRAAAAYHPDKSRTKDEALVNAMTKAFQNIGEAYETLGDPKKRAAYDHAPVKRTARR